MTVEENKALVRRYFDKVVNQRKFNPIPEIISTKKMNPITIGRALSSLIEAFPDVAAKME